MAQHLLTGFLFQAGRELGKGVRRGPSLRRRLSDVARSLGAGLEPEPEVSVDSAFPHETSVRLLDFDAAFLALPEAVLFAVVRRDSRVFLLRGSNGRLLHRALVITDDAGGAADGNLEAALGTRLASAARHFREFMARSPRTHLDELVHVPVHPRAGYLRDGSPRLGNVRDKVERLEALLRRLCAVLSLPPLDTDHACRAVRLCKLDVAAPLVMNYPELSGRLAQCFAERQREPDAVAAALVSHHAGGDDTTAAPVDRIGALLLIADRLDTVVSAFAAGIMPTPSSDVLDLREQAYAVLRILMQQSWALDLSTLVGLACEQLPLVRHGLAAEDVHIRVTGFLRHRLRVLLCRSFGVEGVERIAAHLNEPYRALRMLRAL